MLTIIFSWQVTAFSCILFTLAVFAAIAAIVSVFIYHDVEIMTCLACIAAVLMFFGLFFGIGKNNSAKADKEYKIIVSENVHVVDADTDVYVVEERK